MYLLDCDHGCPALRCTIGEAAPAWAPGRGQCQPDFRDLGLQCGRHARGVLFRPDDNPVVVNEDGQSAAAAPRSDKMPTGWRLEQLWLLDDLPPYNARGPVGAWW